MISKKVWKRDCRTLCCPLITDVQKRHPTACRALTRTLRGSQSHDRPRKNTELSHIRGNCDMTSEHNVDTAFDPVAEKGSSEQREKSKESLPFG